MDGWDVLPFEVGQLAESRSFKLGFRGAWFRCKIKKTSMRKMEGPSYALEYYDFPDEKVTMTKLYQIPQKGSKPTLILRPQYPPIYTEGEVPDGDTITELIVVQADVWKVGDKVDWFDDCYWSGRVTKILSKTKVQITLLQPPAGEGKSYDVQCKDLRPSLDWSIEHGWTIPTSEEGENCRPCARLIKPDDKGPQILESDTVCETAKDFLLVAESSFDSSFSSDTSSSLSLDFDKPREVTLKTDTSEPVIGSNAIARTNCPDSVLTSQFRDSSALTNGDDEGNSSGPTKRMRAGTSVALNSTRTDTLEDTILDLEELVNKVKWLKGILKCETPLFVAPK